ALTKTGKKNQWVVDPGGSRAPKLHLLIVGDRLVLASDPKGATGLGSSTSGAAAARLRPAKAIEAFERHEYAARGWADTASAVVATNSPPWRRELTDFEA